MQEGFSSASVRYEVLGDYLAGPSHIMPTGGTARFALAAQRDRFRQDHQLD